MQREIKDKILTSKLSLICLIECRVRSKNIDSVSRNTFPPPWNHDTNIDSCKNVRIWIAWNNNATVTVLKSTDQLVHCKIYSKSNDRSFLFSGIYGAKSPQIRTHLWDDIINLSKVITEPWILAGDFNYIKHISEKQGGLFQIPLEQESRNLVNTQKDKISKLMALPAMAWFVWIERNNRIFNNTYMTKKVVEKEICVAIHNRIIFLFSPKEFSNVPGLIAAHWNLPTCNRNPQKKITKANQSQVEADIFVISSYDSNSASATFHCLNGELQIQRFIKKEIQKGWQNDDGRCHYYLLIQKLFLWINRTYHPRSISYVTEDLRLIKDISHPEDAPWEWKIQALEIHACFYKFDSCQILNQNKIPEGLKQNIKNCMAENNSQSNSLNDF